MKVLCLGLLFGLVFAGIEEDEKKYLKVVVTGEMDDDDCQLWSQEGDKIYWHYEGTLLDGTPFDSGNFNNGSFEAVLGAGHVITGVDRAMRDMCVGEKRRMTIQPEWGYGERGYADLIPPNSVLVFNVQLQKIERPGGPSQEYKSEL